MILNRAFKSAFRHVVCEGLTSGLFCRYFPLNGRIWVKITASEKEKFLFSVSFLFIIIQIQATGRSGTKKGNKTRIEKNHFVRGLLLMRVRHRKEEVKETARPSQPSSKSFSKLSTYKLIGFIPLSIQHRRTALLHFGNNVFSFLTFFCASLSLPPPPTKPNETN